MVHERDTTALRRRTEECYFHSALFQITSILINGHPRWESDGFLIIGKPGEFHMECGINHDKASQPYLGYRSLAGTEKPG